MLSEGCQPGGATSVDSEGSVSTTLKLTNTRKAALRVAWVASGPTTTRA